MNIIKRGQIVKSIAGFFDVISENKIYRLRASGSLRDNDISPIVGDFVEFKDDQLLTKVEQRKNCLIRPKVANVDQVAIVTSLNEPNFSSLLLDKFLAIVESQNIHPIIIFTKADIGDTKPFNNYQEQGYECLLIDNKNKNTDWEFIKNTFKKKLTVFTGQSGVGKTSTLNNLLNLTEETNEISKALGRGKHTTRVVEIFSNEIIKIIDTPGFSSLEIQISESNLAKSYFDFKIWSNSCKFNSCLHYKEIDCEVKRKYEEGKLLKSRYENYIKILLEIKNGK